MKLYYVSLKEYWDAGARLYWAAGEWVKHTDDARAWLWEKDARATARRLGRETGETFAVIAETEINNNGQVTKTLRMTYYTSPAAVPVRP